ALQADGTPLHAAERYTPDRQDRLAQRRSGQRRLGPGAGGPGAVCGHGRELREYCFDEGGDVGESIPRGRERRGEYEGRAHMLRIRWLLGTAADIARWPPARHSLLSSK